jgi:hypothetical protein
MSESDRLKEIAEGKEKAWKAYKKLSEAEKIVTGKMSAEDRHRNRVATKRRAEYETVREIGPLPAVANQERRDASARSMMIFFVSYFPQSFLLDFGDDHRKVIARLETAILEGGLFALAMPRGSGKTTICVRALLWAILYGHRKFAMLVGASADAAKELLAELKVELETNLILTQDFPEVCFPIQKLEGISQRAKGQMLGGKQTNIGYKGNQIILPTVKDSAASGSIIRVAGLLGRIRGAKYVNADGESMRPDLTIVDDPQTDASAKSENQCAQRERVLSGAILGLAGPGKRIAGVMPCTVIRRGDMADRLLDRSIHPRWNGERCRMVYRWPSNQKLWDSYAELRISDLKQGNDKLPQATEFYADNRQEMDEGSIVGWPARYEPHELSAIQHAVNLKLGNPDTFDAEYQNDPKETLGNQTGKHAATADVICQRASGYAQGEIPREANHLVCAVDVQQNAFFYAVLAVADGFTSWVVDYGVWPDQGKIYYTLSEIERTITHETGVGNLEASLLSGLRRLESHLLSRQFVRDDGASMPIERIVIDANWGPSTKTVYSFVRQSEQRSLWLPWHGRGVSAKQTPINQWPRKPGEIVGPEWRISAANAGQQVPRHIIADVNHWKTVLHQRLQQPEGEPGAMMLYKASPMKHRMLADHLCSEQAIETAGRGRTLVEWQLLTGRDNHFLDCLVMCLVGASVVGVRTQADPQPVLQRPRKSLQQMREEALNRRRE